MAQFASKKMFTTIVLLVPLINIIQSNLIPYSGCVSPNGYLQYYHRQPRHVLPLSPCALRNNQFNYGVTQHPEEGPWKLPMPLNTPCSSCSSYPAPQPIVVSPPPVTPCSQHVPATVSKPPCGDSYLFSCQPNVVPVPCQQY